MQVIYCPKALFVGIIKHHIDKVAGYASELGRSFLQLWYATVRMRRAQVQKMVTCMEGAVDELVGLLEQNDLSGLRARAKEIKTDLRRFARVPGIPNLTMRWIDRDRHPT